MSHCHHDLPDHGGVFAGLALCSFRIHRLTEADVPVAKKLAICAHRNTEAVKTWSTLNEIVAAIT